MRLTPSTAVALGIAFLGVAIMVFSSASGGVLTDWWDNGTFVAQRDGYNATSTQGLTISAADNPANDRVNYTYNISLASATSTATTSASGLGFVNATIGLLMGCDDNEILKWDSATTNWSCDTDTGGAGGDASDKAELETQITDVADFAEADGDTFTGVHDFGGATSLEVPACGTTNAGGEICSEGTATSTALFLWFEGEQHALSATTSKGLLLFDATSTDDFVLWRTDDNIVITKVCFLPEGGTNWVGMFSEFDSDGNSATDLMSGDVTALAGATSCTGDSGDPTANEQTVERTNWVGLTTTSVSGTNDRLHITFYFKWIL